MTTIDIFQRHHGSRISCVGYDCNMPEDVYGAQEKHRLFAAVASYARGFYSASF